MLTGFAGHDYSIDSRELSRICVFRHACDDVGEWRRSVWVLVGPSQWLFLMDERAYEKIHSHSTPLRNIPSTV